MLSGASLTAEEKEKLYKAIDYDENVRVKYPVEVRVVRRCACVLRHFLMTVEKQRNFNQQVLAYRQKSQPTIFTLNPFPSKGFLIDE